jgi:hypothetical protein
MATVTASTDLQLYGKNSRSRVRAGSVRAMVWAWTARVAKTVLSRPRLWGVALAQGWRLRRRGWYRRAPFLPLPDPDYLAFRSITAYGGDGTRPPDPDDVVTYLEWCRSWSRVAR